MKKSFANWKAFGLLEDGIFKVTKGDSKSAIDKFSKAIEMQPEMLDAYSFRGNAYCDLGQYQHALADLDYVIRKSSDHHAAYYNRSIARMALGESEFALADLDRAIELSPQEAGYYLHRSIVHSFREEYDLGLADAATAIELGQAKAGHNNRAVIFEKKGDLRAAISEWTSILEIEHTNNMAHCRRGLIFASLKEWEAASDDLVDGLRNKAGLPDALRQKAEKALLKITGGQS